MSAGSRTRTLPASLVPAATVDHRRAAAPRIQNCFVQLHPTASLNSGDGKENGGDAVKHLPNLGQLLKRARGGADAPVVASATQASPVIRGGTDPPRHEMDRPWVSASNVLQLLWRAADHDSPCMWDGWTC